MQNLRSSLPGLHTLAALPLRDADILLKSAEQLHLTQSCPKTRFVLRRIAVYRRVLCLPPSINLMQTNWAASA
jgi:hypothetical protein